VAVSASEAKGSSGRHNRGASVVALCVVPIPIKGRPRAGNLVELRGWENTGNDKSKCHKRNFVMSETLMWIWHIISDINSRLCTDQSSGGDKGGLKQGGGGVNLSQKFSSGIHTRVQVLKWEVSL